MTIIYPVPEKLPDPRARFIQIINTCHALAETGIQVKLIAGMKRGYSKEDVLQFYGLPPHPNLELISLPMFRRESAGYLRFSWNGLFHLSFLLFLLVRKAYPENHMVLFLRHIKLADFILRFKKILDIPVVFEAHEIFHLGTSNKNKREVIKGLEYRVYRKADTIVSISQSLKEYLIHMGIPQGSIYVIHDAVKREWLDIKKKHRGLYICYTGSLYPWKGVDTLISAMKHLPDEKLMIVGKGSRLKELRSLAISEGVARRVDFVGAVSHTSIPEYLAQAKVVVLPNISDGPSLFSSPLKLFEYMACDIPIVASDIPVFREVLIDNKNALLFEPGNPSALADTIRRITNNPELALRLAGKARKDAENYTYEERARRIGEVIIRGRSRY